MFTHYDLLDYLLESFLLASCLHISRVSSVVGLETQRIRHKTESISVLDVFDWLGGLWEGGGGGSVEVASKRDLSIFAVN